MERTCEVCGGVAVAHRSVRSYVGFVPIGSIYDFRCGQCSAEFTTASTYHVVSTALGSIGAAALAAVFLADAGRPAGYRWGGGGMFAAGAVIGLGYLAIRIRAARRNPARRLELA